MEILSCLMLVKNAGIHTVLCVGQLQLVSDFIARIFKGSEHAVQIYRKIHCFSKRMSDNIHIRYLIIFQYCLQIPFCILDVLWKRLFHLVLRQDVKQVSVLYFFLYKIEMSRSVQMRFVQLDETAIKMYPSGSEEGTRLLLGVRKLQAGAWLSPSASYWEKGQLWDQIRLLRALSRWVPNISGGGHPTTRLGLCMAVPAAHYKYSIIHLKFWSA